MKTACGLEYRQMMIKLVWRCTGDSTSHKSGKLGLCYNCAAFICRSALSNSVLVAYIHTAIKFMHQSVPVCKLSFILISTFEPSGVKQQCF